MKNLGKSFRETYKLYREGQVPETILLRIGEVLLSLEDMGVVEGKMSEIENLLSQPVDSVDEAYTNYLGGDFKLVESFEDLKEIEYMDFDNLSVDGKWPNLSNGAGSFDICEWLDSYKEFVEIFIAWNDAGGPVWFIPAAFVTENVLKSIEMTNKFWDTSEVPNDSKKMV